ncbi:MAG: hypothetical protein QM751_01480 [Paludibacteraceae bacterium]
MINNKLPFKTPDHYFENFALQMDKKTAPPQTINFRRRKSWFYAAAVIAAVTVLGGARYYTTQKEDQKRYADNYESYVLSQVDESSMIDYYINNNN